MCCEALSRAPFALRFAFKSQSSQLRVEKVPRSTNVSPGDFQTDDAAREPLLTNYTPLSSETHFREVQERGKNGRLAEEGEISHH